MIEGAGLGYAGVDVVLAWRRNRADWDRFVPQWIRSLVRLERPIQRRTMNVTDDIAFDASAVGYQPFDDSASVDHRLRALEDRTLDHERALQQSVNQSRTEVRRLERELANVRTAAESALEIRDEESRQLDIGSLRNTGSGLILAFVGLCLQLIPQVWTMF